MLVNILSILSNAFAVVIGGVITWYFSRRYYKKAGEELSKEAQGLRRLTEIMLHAMEDAGMVHLNRDGSFNIIGRIVDSRKPLPPQGAVVGKGDVIEYADKRVEIKVDK